MDDIKNNELAQATEILHIIEDIIAENNGDFSSIINQNLTLKDKLYSKGSTLFLGYFNPCPVEDLIVGKTKRGKITSNKTSSKYTVTYYFEKNIIKMAEDFSSYYLFFYTDVQQVYILGVPKDMKIDPHTSLEFMISKYDENDRICKLTFFRAMKRIKTFSLFAFMDSDRLFIKDKKQNEYSFYIIEKEYFYSENFITKVQIGTYTSYKTKRHIQKYEFKYRGDSYYSYLAFTTEYKVLHKRKFNEFIKKPNYSDYQK